jgi:hypothetical protein
MAQDRNAGVVSSFPLANRHEGESTIPPQTQITWPVT